MIDWGSNVVNGQLVPQPPSSAFFPLTMGAQYRGPGMWPRQGTYQVPPVTPTPALASQMGQSALGNGGSPDLTGGGASLFHPTKNTIIFGFGSLVLGLFMLHYIHYGA